MRADHLIGILKTLDPATDIGPWMRAYKGQFIDTLYFMDAGRAIRIAHRILGSPYSTANIDSSGKPLSSRVLLWKTEGQLEKILETCKELEKAGITAFKITDSGWFHIHIQRDLFYSSFTSSDDPEVWKKKQDKRAAAKAERDRQQALMIAAQREQQQKEMEEWKANFEREQKEKKLAAEKAEREAKEAAERRRKEAEAQREQIRIAQQDPHRSIEVKGGD